MNTSARHSEDRKSAARTHEAEKHEGANGTRAQVAIGAKTHKSNAATTPEKTSSEQADSTGKELRRMSRSELIEVIYALEQDNQSLRKENEKLRAELDDKDIRIATSGSIAEAALSLNHIFEDAQAAADQYLSSIKNTRNSTAVPHVRHTS